MKRLSVRVNTAAAAFREMLPTCSISLAGEVPRRRARAFRRGERGCKSCPYARVYDVIILLKTSPSHVARRSRLASPSHLDSHTRCVLSAHMSAHLSLSAQSLQLSCAPGAVSSSQVSSTSTISVPGAHGERSALQLRHRLFPVPHVRQRTEVDRTPLRSRRIPARKRGSHCSGTCFAPALEPLQSCTS